LRINWFRVFLISVPIALVVAIFGSYAVDFLQTSQQQTEPPPRGYVTTGPNMGGPFIFPGIDLPPTVTVTEAELDDDEEVIGVVANGRPRAYRIKGMTAMTAHLVNDVIDTIPVTVTYCNVTDCVQAFTGPTRSAPLDIWMGGRVKNMMLKTGTAFFWQHTGKLVDPNRAEEQAFATYKFERTSWKDWRTAFPTTDVYLGK
jgi:hypothetical protein